MGVEPILDEPERANDTADERRAASLARRARRSLIFGVVSYAPLPLLLGLLEVPVLGRFVRAMIGYDDGVLVLAGLVLTTLFALLAIVDGLAAVSPDNTQNRVTAFVGAGLGALVLDGFASFSFMGLVNEESTLPFFFLLFGGISSWLLAGCYFHGLGGRRLRDNPVEDAYDEALEHRLLRRAQGSVVLGLMAVFLASQPFAAKLLLDLFVPSHRWYYILRYSLLEGYSLEIVLGSVAMGFAACILASAAWRHHDLPGNSLAWTGTILGMLAVGIFTISVLMDWIDFF